MGRKEIVAPFQNRLRRLRRIEYLLGRDNFAVAYEKATPEQLEDLARVMTRESDLLLRMWIEAINPSDMGPSYNELREEAKRLGIPGYSRISKSTLLSEIERFKHEKG